MKNNKSSARARKVLLARRFVSRYGRPSSLRAFPSSSAFLFSFSPLPLLDLNFSLTTPEFQVNRHEYFRVILQVPHGHGLSIVRLEAEKYCLSRGDVLLVRLETVEEGAEFSTQTSSSLEFVI